MENDEDLYLKAQKELKSQGKKEATWIKALTLTKGDAKAAEYEYINLRVIDFKNIENQNTPDEITKPNLKNSNQVLNTHNFDNKVTNNEQTKEPSKFRYIQAWLLASIISNVLISVAGGFLGSKISLHELDFYKNVMPFFEGIIILLVWLVVVNIKYYQNLKISKLSFWMLTLGSLGVLGNLYKAQMMARLSNTSGNSFTTVIITFSVYFAVVGIFYWYGKKQNRV